MLLLSRPTHPFFRLFFFSSQLFACTRGTVQSRFLTKITHTYIHAVQCLVSGQVWYACVQPSKVYPMMRACLSRGRNKISVTSYRMHHHEEDCATIQQSAFLAARQKPQYLQWGNRRVSPPNVFVLDLRTYRRGKKISLPAFGWKILPQTFWRLRCMCLLTFPTGGPHYTTITHTARSRP